MARHFAKVLVLCFQVHVKLSHRHSDLRRQREEHPTRGMKLTTETLQTNWDVEAPDENMSRMAETIRRLGDVTAVLSGISEAHFPTADNQARASKISASYNEDPGGYTNLVGSATVITVNEDKHKFLLLFFGLSALLVVLGFGAIFFTGFRRHRR